MLFTFAITAPPNTPKTAPVRETLRLKEGWITKISILIPAGHQTLAHLAIYDGETAVVPWGEDQWISGDDETVEWEPDYQLPSEPAELEARAWSEDDTYSHTFYLRVWVEAERAKPRWRTIEEGTRRMTQFVRRVIGEPAREEV